MRHPAVRPGTGASTVVLDHEAARALSDIRHPKHRSVTAYLVATSTRRTRGRSARVCVPTVVRVEAGIDRRAPDTAAFNRLRIHDVGLDPGAADRAAALRVGGGSAVDACVAVAATDAGAAAGDDVVVLTADLTDIPRLLRVAGSTARTARV